MNTWGEALRLAIFGESHGPAVGITIDGLPAGLPVDQSAVRREMQRRAPGQNTLTTARQEADEVEILSGLLDGHTTGAPLCGVIRNSDAHSADYDSRLRPGHADWTALLKYAGQSDARGGGHFSGRLTAPLVFAGSLAKQALAASGVRIYGRISQIGRVRETESPAEEALWRELAKQSFPARDSAAMQAEIQSAQSQGDSVGGVVESVAWGLPAGLGEPFFGSMESCLASLLFSVPAVKAVEFGAGLALAAQQGSQANDPLTSENGVIYALSNHNGGILGGITNGMPLLLRAAFKPTPSISRPQQSVDGQSRQPLLLEIRGRHDPCIVWRAVPVVEAALALAILDRWLLVRGNDPAAWGWGAIPSEPGQPIQSAGER